MMALAFQMIVCLLVAAAIGAAVGWLLRHRSAESHAHSLTDLETELRVKGQALDTAIYELKVKTSAVMALESKVASLESLGRSAQEEVASRQDRIDRRMRLDELLDEAVLERVEADHRKPPADAE